MGNESSTAAKAPQPPVPPVQPPNTPPVDSPPIVSIGAPVSSVPAEPVTPAAIDSKPILTGNPGTYEEIHKKTKEMQPQCFDGAKVVISRGLSSHFQINHTINLSTPMMSGYRFGATYVGTKQFSPQESYPILLGDIDANGNLNANIIHAFSRNTMTRFVAQFQDEKNNSQLVTDYKGSSFTASMAVANPDLINGSGVVVSQYLQRVMPALDIGAECMYQRGGLVPGGQIAVMSLAARINAEKWQLGGSISPMGAGGGPSGHLSYYHRINDTLQIGAELETASMVGDSSATACYQLDIPNAGVTFKGQLDTNMTVQATLEKKLMEAQLPFTFILSAVGNQWKSDYKIGVGLMFG